MKLVVVSSALTLLLMIDASPTRAARRSTPEERQRAVEVARRLEKDPFAEGAAAERMELLKWWSDVDLTARWCPGMLSEIETVRDRELAAAVFYQAPLSAGAAVIERPELAKDTRAFNIAGIEGALRAYASAISRSPRRRIEFLDGLSKPGAIGEYVDSKLPSCK